MTSALRSIYRWSWLVTLPITALFLYWGANTLSQFHRFNVIYDAKWFDIGLAQTGTVEAYELWRLAQLAFDPRVPEVRRRGTKLRRVDLFVSQAAVGELNSELPHSGFRYVSAGLLNGDKLQKIKFRYRGDFANHWWGTKKSLRVKTKKSRLFGGIRTFNLNVPKFAEQINNHLGYRLAARMGLLAPESDMVDVTINGRWRGVHVFVEQPGELFLRRRALMPGDLYVGELIAKDRYTGVSAKVFDHPGLWEKAAVNNHFPASSLAPLKALLALMRHGVPSNELHHGLGELLDMQAWGRFAAYETLTQSHHFDQAHNWRLYFDPARSRFVPIIWDPSAWHPNWMPKRGKAAKLDQIPSDLHALLFTNVDFLRAREAALEEFFRGGESEAFLAEMADLMERLEPSIQVDPFPFTYPRRDAGGPGVKIAAMHRFASAVEKVFAEIREGFLEAPGEVQYTAHGDGQTLGFSVDGRRSVRRIVLRYADPLDHRPSMVRLRYWRGDERSEVDVSGALSISGSSVEIAASLLSRHDLIETGLRGPSRLRLETQPAYYELVLGSAGTTLALPLQVFVDRGGADLEEVPRVEDLPRVAFSDQYEVVTPHPIEKVEIWEGVVVVDGIRELDNELLIRPGTTVLLGPGASLILHRRLTALGSVEAPIRFMPAEADQDPWGALVLLGPDASGSQLAHCELAGGSGLKEPLREYSGMFSVHDVERVHVRSCEFRDSHRADDMVHAVYAGVSFTDTAFLRAASDAVDLDNSEGFFERCRFEQSGNDAVDLMTSRALVLDSVLEGSGDKGISVGEDSRLLAINDRFRGNQIGLQSKDGSVAVLYNVEIRDSEQALHAYQKNWQYGEGGKIFVYKADVRGSPEKITAEKGSRIELYDSYLGADVRIGKRVMLDERVDREPLLAARDKRFARTATEQAAFGDPFPSHWDRARAEQRGASIRHLSASAIE